jgi:PAS domain S-box-containing protein
VKRYSLFPNRLLPQLWGQSIGLVSVVLFVIGLVSVSGLSEKAKRKIDEGAIAFVKGVATSLNRTHQREGLKAAMDQLPEFDTLTGLSVLAVFDHQGNVLGAIGSKAEAVLSGKYVNYNRPSNSDNIVTHHVLTIKEQLFDTGASAKVVMWESLPNPDDATKPQWLLLERNVTDIYETLNSTVLVALAAMFLGVSIIGLLMHRLVRRHVMGIEKVVVFSELVGTSEAQNAVANLDKNLQYDSDEIQRLSNSLKSASSLLLSQRTELEQSKEHLQLLLNASITGVVTFNKSLRITDFNQAAERIFGWGAKDVIGAHLNLLSGSKMNKDFDPYFKQFACDQTGLPMGVPFELKATHMSGETIDTEVVLHSIPRNGELRICASVLDVTAKKSWMNQLSVQRDRAEAANKAKSLFFANMSHELRTPMNGIIGMTELALETNLDDEQREYLETVRGCAKQLMAVVNDVLDFSKIEAGKVKIEAVEFSLSALIEESKRAFSAVARKKKLTFEASIAPGTEDKLVGDPTRLKQVLFNLLDNAFKFTSSGSVALTVSIEIAERDSQESYLLFEVKDSGIGIAPEKHKKVFELFAQADDSTSRQFGGTGLGLSLCKSLATAMEGDVWLDSAEGVGTTFFFSATVSRHLADDGANLSGLDIVSNLSLATDLYSGKRVLVADDDAINRSILTRLVQRLGAEPTVAVDGVEAVELATREEFDLILIDIAMPGLSGIEVTKRVREWERARIESGISTFAAQIVAISGSLKVAGREDCIMAGVDDYLIKPFSSENFFKLLANPQARVTKERFIFSNPKLEIFNAEVGAERLGLDLKTVGDLAAIFLSQLPQFRRELLNAVSSNDVKSSAHWLHSLAGSLMTLGAHRSGHFARQLELAVAQVEFSELAPTFLLLMDELDAVEEAVKYFVSERDDVVHS